MTEDGLQSPEPVPAPESPSLRPTAETWDLKEMPPSHYPVSGFPLS